MHKLYTMWPWTKKLPEPDWIARLDRLEGRVKEIEVEWNGWYDKYRRLYARLAKREQRAVDEPDAPSEARSGNGQGVSNPLAQRLLRPFG